LDYSKVKFVCWGDSLIATGSGFGTVFGTSYTPNRVVYNGGVGGETIAQAAARQILPAAAIYRDRCMMIHDKTGSAEVTDAEYVATVVSMVDYHLSPMFLIIGGIRTTDGSATNEPGGANYVAQVNRNNALAALYPRNFLDVFDLLYDDSTRTDTTHLTATARDDILIPAIAQKLVDLGYMNVTS